MTPVAIRAVLSHGTRTAKLATSGPGGQPHVMPVWFMLDGEELVFTTWGDSVKGRNLRRNPRAAAVVDEEVAPYAFVHIRGHVTLSEDLEELLRFATAIGGRYVGADRAEELLASERRTPRRRLTGPRASGVVDDQTASQPAGPTRERIHRRPAMMSRAAARVPSGSVVRNHGSVALK